MNDDDGEKRWQVFPCTNQPGFKFCIEWYG